MMPSAKEMVQEVRSKGGVMNTLCDFIIRPPRSDYETEDLGPDLFRLGERKTRFVRDDFTLENMRGMTIYCSWYKPFNYRSKATTETKTKRTPLPCVVYCHANCGSRYDGLEAMLVLNHGFTLVTFDFCGSGWSDGEFISLGFYERQDLATVTEYLQSRPDEVDGIAFWGRSMGAVTAIMYASKDPSIRCVVCDSPFGTLRWLIQDLVTNYGGKTAKYVPGFVVKMIVNRMRDRITKRASFDIDDLDTVKYASECEVPGLIFHGKEDDFVLPKQSIKVSESFIGPCLHQMVEGGHNSERTEEITDLIVAYLQLYMIEKPTAARALAKEEAAKRASSENQSVSSKTGPALSGLEVQRASPSSPRTSSSPAPSVPQRHPVEAQALHPHLSSTSHSPPRAPRALSSRRNGVETPPAMSSPRDEPQRRARTPPPAAPPLSSDTEYKVRHLGLVKSNTLMTAEEPIEDGTRTFSSEGHSATGLSGSAGHTTRSTEDDDTSDQSTTGSSFFGNFVDPEEIPRALPIHFTKPRMDRVSAGTDVGSEDDEEEEI